MPLNLEKHRPSLKDEISSLLQKAIKIRTHKHPNSHSSEDSRSDSHSYHINIIKVGEEKKLPKNENLVTMKDIDSAS